ncbi:RHS repeat-associated core domain-containing protein [Chitiniphilus eburneus]|uniref:RHS repeat-associated core domain-containing protein n=1 Tax=Chitiniphilus eburneus TaxID=2571148 RepID=UPI0024832A98|nr:RHS repeat-associated core domain-containing protein [Chitiniphilus eburneus]
MRKTSATSTTFFIYDEQDQLLAEYESTGQARLDTIWLDNIPVAVVQAATPAPKLYYAWSDHLGTPRQLSNPADNKIVWEWAISEPFGHSTANADPDGDGQQLVYNLRFPGQYFDAETGRYYNYFRDYDPRIGRYIQSDPIGLAGGINTYGYVENDPLGDKDALGLSGASPTLCEAAPNHPVCKTKPGNICRLRPDACREQPSVAENAYCYIGAPTIGISADFVSIAASPTGFGAIIMQGVSGANAAASACICEPGTSTYTSAAGALAKGNLGKFISGADIITTIYDSLKPQ